MKQIFYAGCTDTGRVRKDNQDSYGRFPENIADLTASKGVLFIIADGMGGHQAGKQASELAVSTLGHSYFSASTGDINENLRRAFQVMNEHIYQFSRSDLRFRGMGTTCSALVLANDLAFVGHVGDSRIYRIDAQGIEQLTRDHSRVADMVRHGILTEEEAKRHPERSRLSRAIGVRPVAEADIIGEISLREHEFFLMCSDGLTNHVEDEEMHRIICTHAPAAGCKALIDLANERGGSDNITLQVIEVREQNGRMDDGQK